jgi:hypothetical protein
MPEMAPAAADKTARASAGMHHAAATTSAHIAACDTAGTHPAAADMHPAAGVHPTAATTMTAPATMATATTVCSEYGSRDEQASGDCRDKGRFA